MTFSLFGSRVGLLHLRDCKAAFREEYMLQFCGVGEGRGAGSWVGRTPKCDREN